jgi:hypothetical protein
MAVVDTKNATPIIAPNSPRICPSVQPCFLFDAGRKPLELN